MCEKYGRAKQDTDDNITRRMRFTCRIFKATNTHPESVILIAFPRQQWLHERAFILCFTYIIYLVYHTEVIKKCKVHPCTGTEALYRPYGP